MLQHSCCYNENGNCWLFQTNYHPSLSRATLQKADILRWYSTESELITLAIFAPTVLPCSPCLWYKLIDAAHASLACCPTKAPSPWAFLSHQNLAGRDTHGVPVQIGIIAAHFLKKPPEVVLLSVHLVQVFLHLWMDHFWITSCMFVPWMKQAWGRSIAVAAGVPARNKSLLDLQFYVRCKQGQLDICRWFQLFLWFRTCKQHDSLNARRCWLNVRSWCWYGIIFWFFMFEYDIVWQIRSSLKELRKKQARAW